VALKLTKLLAGNVQTALSTVIIAGCSTQIGQMLADEPPQGAPRGRRFAVGSSCRGLYSVTDVRRECSHGVKLMTEQRGTSGRGKSAITHIIDYCLGSGKCSIPVGPIRQTVSWYGLLLQVQSDLIFVARRAPGDQQSTDDYCLAEGPHLALPIRPEKNTTRTIFISKMGALAGLTNLDLAAGDPKGFDARASFRDFAAFNFLPQHIVANPQTLFFKADTTEHREKLRKVFPLALGVVDANYLLAEHEERDLSRRLEELQYEANRRKRASEAWVAELQGYLARSRELGLVTDGTLTADTAPAEIINALRRAVRDPDRIGISSTTVGNTETAVGRLNGILDEEARIARDISDRRRQLQKLLALSHSLKEYGSQLRLQYARDRCPSLNRSMPSSLSAGPGRNVASTC
jgi:hypothetical protein